MRKAAVWLIMFILTLAIGTSTAQDTLLVGPVIAVGTVEQDAIYLYDVATDTIRTLSFGSRWHQVWDFSPDGCRILFTLSDGTNPARLYSARIDGNDMRELVQYPDLPDSAWGVWEPDWSPNGDIIAFTMIRDQPQRTGETLREFHIAWIPPEGGVPEFFSVTGREFSPTWSPDGAWLAYVSYEERVPGADIFSTAIPTPEIPEGQPVPEVTTVTEADIWIVSYDGLTKYNLVNFPTGTVRSPVWSPDSELVSFIYSPSNNNDTFWMIANGRGAIPTQLSFQWNLTLDSTWLPDGTALVGAVRDFRDTAENRLWVIPLVGNSDESATLYVDDPALSHADYPRFSPDGRWLALRSAYSLALVDTQTRQWRLLDESLMGNTPPVWSPAGFAGEGACR